MEGDGPGWNQLSRQCVNACHSAPYCNQVWPIVTMRLNCTSNVKRVPNNRLSCEFFFFFFFLHLFNSREFSVNFSSTFFLFSFSIRIRSNVSLSLRYSNSKFYTPGWRRILRDFPPFLLASFAGGFFFSFLRWRGEFFRGDIFISLKRLWDTMGTIIIKNCETLIFLWIALFCDNSNDTDM